MNLYFFTLVNTTGHRMVVHLEILAPRSCRVCGCLGKSNIVCSIHQNIKQVCNNYLKEYSITPGQDMWVVRQTTETLIICPVSELCKKVCSNNFSRVTLIFCEQHPFVTYFSGSNFRQNFCRQGASLVTPHFRVVFWIQ